MQTPATLVMAAILALLPTSAVPATAAPGEGRILDAGGPTAIPDSYIVKLKDSAVDGAPSLAAAHGGQVRHVYTTALRGFSVTLGAAQARRLAAHPAVDYVAQDHRMRPQGTQLNPPSWALDRIDQRALPMNNTYNYGNTAPDVTAYVIDSGIRIGHPDFGGRARYGWDFVGNDPIADDCWGHGTHVAGIIGGSSHGVAKQVKLVAVRVVSGCGGTSTPASAVVAGIDWVTRNAVRPAVANLSVISGSPLAAVDTAVANSIASGIGYTVAAGNSNANACSFTPGRVPTAITVGATTSSDARASFSNHGTCVDLLAPGVSIISTWINNVTNSLSGTSSAAPFVAGAAALYLQIHPDATPQEVRDAIVANATRNAIMPPPPTGTPNLLLYSAFV